MNPFFAESANLIIIAFNMQQGKKFDFLDHCAAKPVTGSGTNQIPKTSCSGGTCIEMLLVVSEFKGKLSLGYFARQQCHPTPLNCFQICQSSSTIHAILLFTPIRHRVFDGARLFGRFFPAQFAGAKRQPGMHFRDQ